MAIQAMMVMKQRRVQGRTAHGEEPGDLPGRSAVVLMNARQPRVTLGRQRRQPEHYLRFADLRTGMRAWGTWQEIALPVDRIDLERCFGSFLIK